MYDLLMCLAVMGIALVAMIAILFVVNTLMYHPRDMRSVWRIFDDHR